MNVNLLVGLVAAASAIGGGAITAVVSPWIKHHIEKVTSELARKRKQIECWRKMVLDIADSCKEDQGSAARALQVHPDYLSLEPLLSEEVRRSVYARNFVVTSGQSLPYVLDQVKHGIAEIEKLWGIR